MVEGVGGGKKSGSGSDGTCNSWTIFLSTQLLSADAAYLLCSICFMHLLMQLSTFKTTLAITFIADDSLEYFFVGFLRK